MTRNAWPATPAVDAGDTASDRAATEEEPAPTGTLFFMLLFLLVMVGLWLTAYWLLLER